MRRLIVVSKRLIGFFTILGLFATAPLQAEPKSPPSAADVRAESLVRQALEAELTNEVDRRSELLEQAISCSPNFKPARWHGGFVNVGEKWLSLDEAQDRASADERLVEYRRLREASAGSPNGDLFLARWCRNNSMEPVALVHWLKVLAYQPNHQEALTAIGRRWVDGQLLTHEEAEQARKQVQRTLRERKRWTPVVARWRREVEDNKTSPPDSVLQELRTIDDAGSMLALEHVMAQDHGSEADSEVDRELSLQLLEVLGTVPDQWATESLVRHAVYHHTPEVRAATTSLLKPRPLHSYVPMLVAALEAPLEVEVSVTLYPNATGVSYQHQIYQEGADADLLLVSVESDSVVPQFEKPRRLVDAESRSEHVAESRATFVSRKVATAEKKAAHTQLAADRINADIARRNERIQYALMQTTGVYLEASPQDWWYWWGNYNEYDTSEERPVYEKRFFRQTRRTITAPSCFAPGTKVWAETGPLPIEQIKPGDLVLSQNPDTGELAYKPVLETTTRDPAPMVNVGLGPETISATRGHPFWVAGAGWQMAKELEPGALLHGVNGAVVVDRLDEVEAPKAWYEFARNLVVADFHTYFVGDGKLLVHDNILREPTRALVPGLVP